VRTTKAGLLSALGLYENRLRSSESDFFSVPLGAIDMAFQVREEVLNILLAELLEKRGLLSVPETIRSVVKAGKKQKRLPDVTVFDLLGLRIIIEQRIGKSAATKTSLTNDAKKRVEEGLSPICLAVIYPPSLAKLESLQEQTH